MSAQELDAMDLDAMALQRGDFDAIACIVFGKFLAHGDNNEAAMRAALLAIGADKWAADRAELARLRAVIAGARRWKHCARRIEESILEHGGFIESPAGDWVLWQDLPASVRDDMTKARAPDGTILVNCADGWS